MKKLNIHIKLTGMALLMGILLTLSWPPSGLFPLVFIGFVPLFFIHLNVYEHKLGPAWAFLYGYLGFLSFNLGTTWWVWNASAGGAVMAFILNSLLMNLPFMFLFNFARKSESPLRIWPFIWAWLSFEYLHFRWDGTYPWLTLGNVFAGVPSIVQWYEYTGAVGGSLWILWVNKGIFQWLHGYNAWDKQMRFRKAFHLTFFRLFAPIFLSYYVGVNYDSRFFSSDRLKAGVLVVQPNIDPYKDKFGKMTPYEQTLRMLELADREMDSTIQLVIFPETALVGNLNEKNLQTEETIQLVRKFMHKYPQVSVLTGADTYRDYAPGEKPSSTAREYDPGLFYDAYNTALFLTPGNEHIGVYHKSKLVPGVERLPFASVLKYVEKYAIDMGGTTGSLGVDPEASVFSANAVLKVAPVICYESIFGAYVADYINKGASLICIITNDGWWGDTPGYKQHLAYASLRAIETRRHIARSANTGITGFIDDKGELLSHTRWWEPAVLKYDVPLNSQLTFYVRHGDYLSILALVATAYLLWSLFFFKKLQPTRF